VTFKAALAAVDARAPDLDRLDELARTALAEGEETAALERIVAAAERSNAPFLWQWAGLLHRSLDEHEAALEDFRRAAELAPANAGIAHGRARVALEAGLDAVDLFLRARSLAPQDGSVLLGLAAARNAAGEGARAAAELSQALDRSPEWIAGYEPLAQLLSTLGQREQATEALERALARRPQQQPLWTTLFGIRVRQENFPALAEDIGRAEAAGMAPETLAFHKAVAAAELDPDTFPAVLFEGAPAEIEPSLSVWRIRHLLRRGAIDAVLPLIDQALESGASAVWPYAASAWCIAGDSRSEWLEGGANFVQTLDLTPDLPPISDLADTLGSLHRARGEYLDQSVRGGTQTDGPLLSRIDPLVRRLRSAIVSAVESYIARLPAPDSRHPLLAERRDRQVRFSGSWSVRLRSGGRHSNHVHPQGWISSALYIALPPRRAADPGRAGWLTLGQPPDNLGVALEPWRKIEPAAGRLVLFPSWMWHGTVPFAEGERLTVAFDVRPPI
jgi:tetratricopeptide (TPR) repeat protein